MSTRSPGGRRIVPGTVLHAARVGLIQDRVRLVALPAVTAAGTALLIPSYSRTYGTEAHAHAAAASAQSSRAQLLLYGELSEDAGIAQIAAWEMGAMTCLILGAVVVLRAVARSRGEEDTGRAELLHSAGAGPLVRLAGQGIVVTGECLALGCAAGVGMLRLDAVDGAGAAAYGAAVGATCLLLGMSALVVAQVLPDASAGRTAGLLLLGLLQMGAGMRAAEDWDWAGWASPMRLRAEIDPGGDSSWWPCLWAVVACLGLAGLAAVLAVRRDLGMGVVRLRAPWADGALHAHGPGTLCARLGLGHSLAWASATCLVAGMVTAMGQDVVDLAGQGALSADSGLATLLEGEDPGVAFLEYVGAIVGAMAAGQAVSLTGRSGADEQAGRIEAVLATGTAPRRVLVSWWLTAAMASASTLLGASLVAGHVGDSALGTQRWEAMRAVAGQWPAALAAAGLSAALCGLAPRARALAWVPVVLGLGITQLGTVLDLPRKVLDAAPFVQAGQPTSLWLAGAGAAGLALGAWGIGRRDAALGAGARHPAPGAGAVRSAVVPAGGQDR